MSEMIKQGQMHVVDADGSVVLLHQETDASVVLIDNNNNNLGDNGTSAIPSDIDTIQKLANKLGKLAFKSKIESTDLTTGIIVNNLTTTKTG